MRRCFRLALFAALTSPLWVSAADAASVDCKKAASKIETTICKDPDLDSYDSQLEAAYQGALDRSNNPAQIKAREQAWLKERDACADTKCMSAAYQRQIGSLSAVSDEPPICEGATTPEMNSCQAEYSRRADRELARYVAAARKRLMDKPKDDAELRALPNALASFDASQASWETYRKAECDAYYDWWSAGTIRTTMYETCWQTVTKSRTNDVWSIWLGFMDSTPPILPKPVAVK